MVIATCLKMLVGLRSPSHLSLLKKITLGLGFSTSLQELSWNFLEKNWKNLQVSFGHNNVTAFQPLPLLFCLPVSSSPATATWLRLRGFYMESRGPVVVVVGSLSFGLGGRNPPRSWGHLHHGISILPV